MRTILAPALLAVAFPLVAGGWPAIPASVWAIKEGAKGAVVLEERMAFKPKTIEYTYRVRIFAEAGRGAAEINDLPSNLVEVKGRTVYPDGKMVEFNSRKDFAVRKVEVGGDEDKRTHLVVPGVTTDCVVEIQWSEWANGQMGGLPARLSGGLYGHWFIGNAYPTTLWEVEVPKNFPLAFTINQGGVATPTLTEKGINRIYTFKDMPAFEELPYSLYTTERRPSLVIFYQPEDLVMETHSGPQAFWNLAARDVYKEWMWEGHVNKGSTFKKFLLDIQTDLPATPHAQAVELLNRLQARIGNLNFPTVAEKANLPKDEIESRDLDKTIKSGRSDSDGVRLLYYHLLKGLGHNPKVGMVCDREISFFAPGFMNPWQFQQRLIGVEEAGKGILWLDPTMRFATPGLIDPDYAGVPALVVDTKSWTATKGDIPGMLAESNRRNLAYTLKLTDEGEEFEAKGAFTGYPEYRERRRFLGSTDVEQQKTLKDRFEKDHKGLVVSKTTVQNVETAGKAVSWEVVGTVEREPGRRREVYPFPGMIWPLHVPDQLADLRTKPIVLPYLSITKATSTFEIPKGHRLSMPEPLQRENQFGKVDWSVAYDASTRKATVTLNVEVLSVMGAPAQWGQFKNYLGWISDACRRSLVIEKGE